MCNVLIFPRHKFVKCKPTCQGCCLCLGGLQMCDTCGGGEAELPTDCPGRRMTFDEREHVVAGRLDYVFGKGWVRSDWQDNVPFDRRGLK